MPQGLDVSDVVNVQVIIGPVAVGNRNFGVALIAGSSPVINPVERIRYYSDLTEVAGDFGISAPEYLAADVFFSQIPTPPVCGIGRFLQAASAGQLICGILSPQQRQMSNFNGITTGAVGLTIDGVAGDITGINLSTATSLSQVAALLQAAIGLTVNWNGESFVLYSDTTGQASTVGYMTTPATGVDLSALLGGRNTQALIPVPGMAAESALACAQILTAMSNGWYGLVFAPAFPLTDVDHLNVAAYIEGCVPSRMYGFTTSLTAELFAPNPGTLGFQLNALKYSKTTWLYSSSNPYAVLGMLGRAYTVNFLGSNTTITLKFKQILGVAAENLTETQALALAAIGGNVFVNYSTGGSLIQQETAIVQQGTMANGRFFDEVHGLDWLQNFVQNGLFNLFYTTTTKVPQTEPGTTRLLTQLELSLEAGIINGFMAPGVWTGAGFGQLSTGDTLTKGYYTYAIPQAAQSQADREARHGVPLQAAIKLAGAVHDTNVLMNVSR